MSIGQANSGGSKTSLSATIDDDSVLDIQNGSDDKFSQGITCQAYQAVIGRSEGIMSGRPPTPIGVVGHYAAPHNRDAGGVGVLGDIIDIDDTNGPQFISKGVGVYGRSGTALEPGPGIDSAGVVGEGSRRGVVAVSKGRALDVRGKSYFSNSGTGHIAKGSKQRTVRGAVLDKNAVILVTLQGPAGPQTVVRYAIRRSSTSFTVYLNKKAHQRVKFGWQIIN